MRLDWLILADYAEVRDSVATIVGAAWNRISRPDAPTGLPPDAVAMFEGAVAMRLLFDPAETRAAHHLEVRIESADHAFSHAIEGTFSVAEPKDPADIDEEEGIPLLLPINLRVPLPTVGRYTVAVSVDTEFLGSRTFSVI